MSMRKTALGLGIAATVMGMAGPVQAGIFKKGPPTTYENTPDMLQHICRRNQIEIYDGNGHAIVVPTALIGRNGEVVVSERYGEQFRRFRNFGQLTGDFIQDIEAGQAPYIGEAGMDYVEEYAGTRVPVDPQILYSLEVQSALNDCSGANYNGWRPVPRQNNGGWSPRQ